MNQRIRDIMQDACDRCHAHQCRHDDGYDCLHYCLLNRNVDGGCILCFLPAFVIMFFMFIDRIAYERYWRSVHCKGCDQSKNCKVDVYECMS